MPDGDQGLAQAVYLAQMFTQRGTCQCTACQLLRQSTEAMIKQVLAKPGSAQAQIDPTLVAKVMESLGGTTLEAP